MASSKQDPDARSGAEPLEDSERGASDTAGAEAVAALERELDELRSISLRATADYQNLRRRMQGDIDAAVARALRPLLQDLLLVVDALDMALASPCTTAECKSLMTGVQMTRVQLASALERSDVRPVPEGGAFDPALHQAVERVETDEQAHGTILATLRTGWTIKGQILRPAQVRVAVGGGTEAEAAETAG
jgi:molecular chaperone GrpE